jgi:hypothetical protein
LQEECVHTNQQVVSKLQKFASGGGEFEGFSVEENRVIAAMLTVGLLNSDAFRVTSPAGTDVVFQPIRGEHPFAPALDAELHKSWYDRASERKTFRIARDVVAAAAFLASLLFAILEITERV